MTRHAIFYSLFSIISFSLQAAEFTPITKQPQQTVSHIGGFTPAEEFCNSCITVTPMNIGVGVCYAVASNSSTATVTMCKTVACLYCTQAVCASSILCCSRLAHTDQDDKNK